jgi:chromosomal replication initiation ATPase DnaA
MGEGHKEEYYDLADQRFLGTEGFAEKLRGKAESRPKKRKVLEVVIKTLAKELDVGTAELVSSDRSWRVSKARTIVGYILVRREGYGLGEVASYFGRDSATMGSLIGRLAERMERDSEARRETEKLHRGL